ncbi:MAG TPA: hypothetical protein VGS07_07015 [Thermoanaerobaculia bacterium]|jgi:hypothetical protein|nr:hypothetical protein [Thermoanaerobaculia bacterium]
MRAARSAVLGLMMGLAFATPAVVSHPFQGSIATLLLQPDYLQVEITLGLRDLDKLFTIDADHSRSVDRRELVSSLPKAYAYLRHHFFVTVDGSRLDLQPFWEDLLRFRITNTVPQGGYPESDYDSVHIGLLFRNTLAARPREVGVELDFFGEMGDEHLNTTKFIEMTEAGPLQEHIVLSARLKSYRFKVHSPVSPRPGKSEPGLRPLPSSPK